MSDYNIRCNEITDDKRGKPIMQLNQGAQRQCGQFEHQRLLVEDRRRHMDQERRQQPRTRDSLEAGCVLQPLPMRIYGNMTKYPCSVSRQQTAHCNETMFHELPKRTSEESHRIVDDKTRQTMVHSLDRLQQGRHRSSFETGEYADERMQHIIAQQECQHNSSQQNFQRLSQKDQSFSERYADEDTRHRSASQHLQVPQCRQQQQRCQRSSKENYSMEAYVSGKDKHRIQYQDHTQNTDKFLELRGQNTSSENQAFGTSDNDTASAKSRSKESSITSHQQTVRSGFSEDRFSHQYVGNSPMGKYFLEALERQRRFVVKTMETSMAHISVDLKKLSDFVTKNDGEIRRLIASYSELDHQYSQIVYELMMRHSTYDGKIAEARNITRQHKELASKLVTDQCNTKTATDDELMKNNTEYILKLCKLNDDIEALITNFKKEFAASDERRRIYMESTRFRIHTSSTYVKNAIQVWKTSTLKALGRTNKKVTSQLLEEKVEWKKDLELLKQHNKDEMDKIEQKIKILEEDTKKKINSIAKSMDELERRVISDASGSENFRKIVRSYTSTSKSLTDQLSGEIKDIESDLYQRLKQSDAGICKLKLDFESMYNSKMEDKKVKNDIIDKQVKYLSRQVKILLFHVKKNAK